MNVLFTDNKIMSKISDLIKDIMRNPTNGIRKPEYLKNDLEGWLSRRINLEYRLIYKIENSSIVVAKCRYHY